MAESKCEKCLNGTMFVSENGYHYGCTLSAKKAMLCLLDRNSQFVEHPMRKEREADG